MAMMHQLIRVNKQTLLYKNVYKDDYNKSITLAPITKKPGFVIPGKGGSVLSKKDSMGKSGSLNIGKSSSSASKSGNTIHFGGKSSSPLNLSSKGEKKSNAINLSKPPSILAPANSSKNYMPASFATPSKSGKSSASFGIIWIPTRRNKKKDVAFNPHKNYDDRKDRTPSMYNYMSGDSQGHSFSKKKEDDTDPLMPEKKLGLGPATVATASAAVSTTDLPQVTSEANKPEEKQEFIEQEKEDKEAGGDSDDKNDSDYLENKTGLEDKYPDTKWEKDKSGDKVDSVYLRPPPPHKVRSTTSTTEDEDCGIKCLYYTLQCCDCVLQ